MTRLQEKQHLLTDSQIALLMGNINSGNGSNSSAYDYGGGSSLGSARMSSAYSMPSAYSLASAGGLSRAGTANMSYLGSIAEGWDWEEVGGYIPLLTLLPYKSNTPSFTY